MCPASSRQQAERTQAYIHTTQGDALHSVHERMFGRAHLSGPAVAMPLVCNKSSPHIPPFHLSPLPPVAADVTADNEDLVLVPLGSELQISCSLDGIPPPDTVTWRHNGSVLLTSDPLISIDNSITSTSLTKMDISEDGGGLYECEASNEVGSNAATTTVRVQCK